MSNYLGFDPTDRPDYYFVSYNNEDADRVGALAGEMARIGIPLWYDYGIEYGRNWAAQINERLAGARAMILFFTKGILLKESSYVQKEFKIARLLGKKVIVLILDRVENADIPTSKLDWWVDIMDNHCLNVYSLTDRAAVIGEVKRALGIAPGPSLAQAPGTRAPEPTIQPQRPSVPAGAGDPRSADKKPSPRPLRFYWIVDCSGSMHGYRIATVNYAIRDAIRSMGDAAKDHPEVRLLVGTLIFSNGARWVTPGCVPVDDYSWTDLSASGGTDLGRALDLMADELASRDKEKNAFTPVLVLLTDGAPTDSIEHALKAVLHTRSVRIAVAIGDSVDNSVLEAFTGNKESVLKAQDANEVIGIIRFVSTIARKIYTSGSGPSAADLSGFSGV